VQKAKNTDKRPKKVRNKGKFWEDAATVKDAGLLNLGNTVLLLMM